jgi:hypothetical protein
LRISSPKKFFSLRKLSFDRHTVYINRNPFHSSVILTQNSRIMEKKKFEFVFENVIWSFFFQYSILRTKNKIFALLPIFHEFLYFFQFSLHAKKLCLLKLMINFPRMCVIFDAKFNVYFQLFLSLIKMEIKNLQLFIGSQTMNKCFMMCWRQFCYILIVNAILQT